MISQVSAFLFYPPPVVYRCDFSFIICHEREVELDNKLGIFPITCTKYEPTRVKTAMGTWAKDHLDKLSFIGDREITDQSSGRTLQMDCMKPKDTWPALTENPYEDAPHKLFNAYRRLAESDYDWLFFCDDDTYVKVHLLEEYVERVIQKVGTSHIAVWGMSMRGNYPADRTLDYPSGGAGFLTNRITLATLAPVLSSVPRSTPDSWADVMTGAALRTAGIPIIDHRVFYDGTPEEEWAEWQWTRGIEKKPPCITYHYMTPEKMIEFYNMYHISRPAVFPLEGLKFE